MAKRTNDPEGMRRRVLDVAAAAFQQAGYHATGMHDLMRQAGITGGALYHHFPTKKALALAVIAERVGPQVEETWIAPVLAAPSAAAGIKAVFAEIVAGLDARGAVSGCPLNNLALELSLSDPDFRAGIQAVFANWRAALAAKLAADGHEDPGGLATFVVAAYSGAMAMAKADQTSGALAACARRLDLVLAPQA